MLILLKFFHITMVFFLLFFFWFLSIAPLFFSLVVIDRLTRLRSFAIATLCNYLFHVIINNSFNNGFLCLGI
jgi:hypothetical protein